MSLLPNADEREYLKCPHCNAVQMKNDGFDWSGTYSCEQCGKLFEYTCRRVLLFVTKKMFYDKEQDL